MKWNVIIITIVCGVGTAMAELPPPSDTVKAQMDEKKAKAAWQTKVEAFQLCKAQDRVAAEYLRTASKTAGVKPPASAAPPCTEPGAFAYTPARPLEAAGAHSPAETAASPPNSDKPHADVKPNSPSAPAR
jgi:hypothetical protein